MPFSILTKVSKNSIFSLLHFVVILMFLCILFAKAVNLCRPSTLSVHTPKPSSMKRLYNSGVFENSDSFSSHVPLVVTYSKQLPDISNILRKHHSVLSNSAKLRAAFKQPPIVAYRKDANICDTLIHMKTNRILKKEKLCQCKVCEKIVRSEVTSTAGNNAHKVEATARCTDRNKGFLTAIKGDRRKIINYHFVQGEGNQPSCQRYATSTTRCIFLFLNSAMIDIINPYVPPGDTKI